MQIMRLQGESSFGELVRRVFGIDRTHPQAKEAEAALTASNPHLGTKIGNLPQGTPIVVPAVPGLAQQTTDDPRLLTLLGQVEQAAKAATAAAAGAARPTTMQDALAGRMALAGRLVAAGQKTARRSAKATEADKTMQKAVADGLKQVQSDLAAFKRSHGL
jgi:hypothetical protein